ncbi:MAG: hypothetical protein C4309_01080 [Chloroflexota bacterium]
MGIRFSRDGLTIFLILLACYAYFLPRWADWNQNSRFDLVRAIVEKGTLAIDDYAANTGDYATVGGHIYSDKAPGLSFAAVPIYSTVNRLMHIPGVDDIIQRLAGSPAFAETLNPEGSGLLRDKVHAALGLTVVTFFLVMLPSALLGVLLYAFLGHLGFSRPVRVTTPLIYGLATIAFPYSGAFYAHQFTAVLLFGAFYLAFLMRQRRLGSGMMPVVGFLLTYSVISEYPTALIAGAIGIYALASVPDRRWTLGAVLAGLPPLLMLGLYNAAIFGTPFKLGYEYSTLWAETHKVGFLSLSLPTLEALWGITFSSYRGLYFLSPILLLTWPGLLYFWKAREWRAESILCGWAVVSFMLFNASSVMWPGGYSIGPRYLVPMLPFAAVALGFGLTVALRRRGSYALVLILTLWSWGLVWIETISGQAFPDYTPEPLINYSVPRFIAGDIARNLGMALGLRSWASLLPLVGIVVILMWRLLNLRQRLSRTKAIVAQKCA